MTQAEAVATHLGWDVADVKEYVYQPSRNARQVYAIGERYYTAGTSVKPSQAVLEDWPIYREVDFIAPRTGKPWRVWELGE